MSNIYKVVLVSSFLKEGAINVFHYFSPQPYSPSTMAGVFLDLVMPSLTAIAHVTTQYTLLKVTDAAGIEPVEYTIDLNDYTGVRLGNESQSFVSWSYALYPYTNLTRAGRKAFMGVNEDDTLGNNPQVFFEDNLDNLSPKLSDVLTEGTFEFLPVIYRPVAGTQLGVANPVLAAAFTRLSTQNSRKTTSGGGLITSAFTNATHDITDPPNFSGSLAVSQEAWQLGGGVPTYWTVSPTGNITAFPITL